MCLMCLMCLMFLSVAVCCCLLLSADLSDVSDLSAVTAVSCCSALTHVEYSAGFMLKLALKEYPIQFLFVSFGVALLACGVCLRTTERYGGGFRLLCVYSLLVLTPCCSLAASCVYLRCGWLR